MQPRKAHFCRYRYGRWSFFHFTVWLMICALLFPAPLGIGISHAAPIGAYTGTGDARTLVHTSPEQGQGGIAPLQGVSKEGRLPSLVAEGPSPFPPPASPPAAASSFRPRTITEIMFNGVTGFMGMPGLVNNAHDSYDPSVDQGLGFHADGTARRADGTTGTNAASTNFDGRRAASYMGHGLGYGSGYGTGANDPSDYYGMGYDPATGRNDRLSASSALYHARRGGDGYGLFSMDSPQNYFMQRGLNYGMGMVNSAVEGLFLSFMESPYGGGKARLNFMVDLDSRVNGEGDVVLPLYDSKHTTVFTHLGARSISGISGGGSDGRGADRWIGNFGLGQRWYPTAENDGIGQDAGTLMLGYNAFFDNDFSRSHQRGGVGIEAQYDWVHLAANYYAPLSGWKGSKDFDSNFVKERAAEGWDVRGKGYLPFYRNLAVTGAYTQWFGDHVGMFSSSKLEKDPKVWSYGLEYTPIPLVSGFVTQRSTEKGRSDTEFGLRFTYTFSMPWDEQTSHSKVAEMRTVGGSRHEFVDRENRIILEYKAKNNYQIEFVGRSGDVFTFRLKHAFAGYAAGKTVRVSAMGVATLAEGTASPGAAPTTFFARLTHGAGEFLGGLFSPSAAHAADLFQTYITDRNGEFRVIMTGLGSASTVTVQAGDTSRTFTIAESVEEVQYVLTLVAGTANPVQTGSSAMIATFVDSNNVGVLGKNVVFTWKTKGGTQAQQAGATILTDASGVATYPQANPDSLNRVIVVTATVEGQSATAEVQFGISLPNDFIVGPGETYPNTFNGVSLGWNEAVAYCASLGGQLPENKFYAVAGGVPKAGRYWTRVSTLSQAVYLSSNNAGFLNNGYAFPQTTTNQVTCVE